MCDPPKSYNCYSVSKPEIDKNLGLLYMLIFLVLNMVILLNLVIAILATVYNEYSSFKRGLFYDTLIAALPKYKHDRFYGYLTAFPGIFAPFLLMSIPPMHVLKFASPQTAQWLNSGLCMLAYTPIGFFASIYFAVVNALVAPLAYLSVIRSKLRLSSWYREFQRSKPIDAKRTNSLFVFVFFGWIHLFVRQALDFCQFVVGLYRPAPNVQITGLESITPAHFTIVEEELQQLGGIHSTK